VEHRTAAKTKPKSKIAGPCPSQKWHEGAINRQYDAITGTGLDPRSLRSRPGPGLRARTRSRFGSSPLGSAQQATRASTSRPATRPTSLSQPVPLPARARSAVDPLTEMIDEARPCKTPNLIFCGGDGPELDFDPRISPRAVFSKPPCNWMPPEPRPGPRAWRAPACVQAAAFVAGIVVPRHCVQSVLSAFHSRICTERGPSPLQYARTCFFPTAPKSYAHPR